MITINKTLLENYRFSDAPNGWILEAKGFHFSAQMLHQALKLPRVPHSKFISMPDANLNQNCRKTIGFLYAIAIELFLKALYSCTKLQEDQENVETFSHNVVRLNQKLISKKVLQKDELDVKTLELVNITLSWFGRYYKPLSKDISKVINDHFEQVPDQPEMLRAKFSMDSGALMKLEHMATLLSSKVNVNPSSMDLLLFTPF